MQTLRCSGEFSWPCKYCMVIGHQESEYIGKTKWKKNEIWNMNEKCNLSRLLYYGHEQRMK